MRWGWGVSDLAAQADELESMRATAPGRTLADQADELESMRSASKAAQSKPDVIPAHTRMVPARKPETISELVSPPKQTYLNAQQMRMIPRYTDPASTPELNANDFPEQVGGGVTDLTGSPLLGAAAKTAASMAPFNPASVIKSVGRVAIPMAIRAAESMGLREVAKEAPLVATGSVGGSVGASAVKPVELVRATAANSSPELKDALEAAIKKGPVNHDAVVRHVEADSLPVPVRLSEGQASQDVALLSTEQNSRGKYDKLAKFFNQQNKDLSENTNLIREQAAPDVFTTSQPAHGETIIDAYKAKDAAANAGVSAKYKALEDANGGQFPLDVKTFISDATQKLHKQLLTDHVPAQIKTTIARLSKDGMTFENFEALRTNLARIQRSAADGNERAAAGVIRNALEELPMPAEAIGSSLEGSASISGAGSLKALADEARSAAKARFSMIESDPAYKAVVNGKATADNFIQKHVINAPLKDVQTLMNGLAHDPAAQQTIRAGVIDSLKAKAGLIDNTGNFSQAGYNRALEQIRPKLNAIFESDTKNQLETLGNVARYTQAQPRGSYVNNSNTLVGAMGEMAKEGAKGAAEGAANLAAGGVPVGTWIRKASAIAAERKAMNATMKPGAGILLRDLK